MERRVQISPVPDSDIDNVPVICKPPLEIQRTGSSPTGSVLVLIFEEIKVIAIRKKQLSTKSGLEAGKETGI